jgi:hypothetical protein
MLRTYSIFNRCAILACVPKLWCVRVPLFGMCTLVFIAREGREEFQTRDFDVHVLAAL